jgi:two-component system chemotaxis sensor kinase CheA
MSIDLSQFHQVFYEESYEGLDNMESALLNIDLLNIDDEAINEIFRAAHSIKGGSGTFGFSAVAEFTHVIETLLDEIRGGQRKLNQSLVEIFLASVDCTRRMLQQLESGDDFEIPEVKRLKSQVEAILSNTKDDSDNTDSREDVRNINQEEEVSTGWHIFFKPDKDVLKTGNEPIRMFRELTELGDLQVTCLTDMLPKISAIAPEDCYLAWDLVLKGEGIRRESIDEAFEWVVDESELRIEPLNESTDNLNLVDHERPDKQTDNDSQAVSLSAINTESSEPENTPLVANKTPVIKNKSRHEVSSIRVGIDKVDSLINMVGELVITQSMLGDLGRRFNMDLLPKLLEGLDQLSQNTREMQESVMRIRMLPISFTFSRFPRLVHDISRSMGKEIELKLLGEQTELDKTVMEKIGDPLVHLVRNSLDHGIEMPADRIAAGKPSQGTITLNAYHQGGNIVIKITDDGQGLNKTRILQKAISNGLVKSAENLTDDQINDLIFRPGFSTAESVTDISGRGVGMDVVRRNINELNGTVEVESTEGEGTTFTIRLPLTLAILDGQIIRVGDNNYILPLISIIESIQDFQGMIHRVAGDCDVLRLRNEYVPIIQLSDIFHLSCSENILEEGIMVVVEGDNMKVAILVDDLLAQQQVVIKSLEDNYRKVEGVSGATILGDGTVSLILDISGLIKLAGVSREHYKKKKQKDGRAA